jgi:hypothetical protein
MARSRVFELLADKPKARAVPAHPVTAVTAAPKRVPATPALTADRAAQSRSASQNAKKEFLFRVLRQPGTSEASKAAIAEQLRAEFKIDPAASLANREHAENARANDARARHIQEDHDAHERALAAQERALMRRYNQGA